MCILKKFMLICTVKFYKNNPVRKPIIKLFDKLILLLLGFLGVLYTSCTYMYGAIEAEYEISGKVTDKTGKSIQEIRVINQNHAQSDTLYTDPDGKFHFQFWGNYPRLKVEDIDGEANGGEFLPQEIEVILDLVKKGWGNKPDKYAKKITVELEKNEVIPEYGVPIAPFKP